MKTRLLGFASLFFAFAACNAVSQATTGNETCSTGAPCGSGSNIQVCTTQDANGACSSIRYKTSDGKSFTCNACTDCSQAVTDVTRACGGSVPGGGSTSSGGSSGTTTNGNTTCTNGAPCSTGGNMQVCTTLAPNGACASIEYKAGGKSFTCDGCTNCTDAAKEATNACIGSSSSGGTSSGGTSSGGGGEICSQGSTCPNGVTLSYCYITTGGVCSSARWKTSNGTSYACASCGDCTAAAQAATAECQNGSSSSGGTSSGSTSSGGSSSGGACSGVNTGNAACDSCVGTSCCSEYTACVGSSECVALNSCLGNCSGDQTCANNCASQHQGGVGIFNALAQCAQSSCSTQCQ